jgi:hypothetical protein
MLDTLCRPDSVRSGLVQVLIDYALVLALVAMAAAAIVPGFLAAGAGTIIAR